MYFYLEKTSLMNGNLTVIFQTENRIDNYKEITNFGELVEFKGDNIPAQWEYSISEDTLYDINDKPSPYHVLKNSEWVVEDEESFKEYCFKIVDSIKADVLEYGFDYNGHRQRCRDKDITFMAITALVMFLVKTFLNRELKKKWYFEDNHFEEFDITGLTMLMLRGSTFVQAVYDTENFFKILPQPKLINKEEFLLKVKDYQDKAMAGD